ncbi:hypothetical protein CAPTEDRAFT_196315 [Capitella teleta]|uniref:Uncharacterized protein n=1 Tax=Capitella teleta TaxID=283909 RepID=R7T4S8_CAPTE|nr:hypothetical protein CAPTEDRAFT_196315 [Capitella teleta]|eukprot:ELT87886.1 hypothetical protein CAPTEDRAFT_196315 [Capitella teleta]
MCEAHYITLYMITVQYPQTYEVRYTFSGAWRENVCVHGDYNGPYRNGLTCAVVGTQQPWRCYDNYYLDDCCSTCRHIKDQKNNPDCPYGDHNHTCLSIEMSECENPELKKACCERCLGGGGPPIACPLGDLSSSCSIEKNWHCYSLEQRCCSSCLPYKTNISGCKYGDRASWCPNIPPSQCYQDDDLCCEHCNNLRINASDEYCQYGDRAVWCETMTAEQCYISSNAKECCVTCKAMFTGIEGFVDRIKLYRHALEILYSTGCEYGDKADFCQKDNFKPYECYSQESRCCARCAQLRINQTGCKYGDRQSGCAEIDCEDPIRHHACCYTCRNWRAKPAMGDIRVVAY